MNLQQLHDIPDTAPDLAHGQIADCGASSEARVTIVGYGPHHGAELARALESHGVMVLSPRERHEPSQHVGHIGHRSRRSVVRQAVAAALMTGAMTSGLPMTSFSRQPAQPRQLTEEDAARISAAQAKRDRRAAKRAGAQP